ncbi:MAG: hypothetical protein SFU99_07135 [Saprospiraceae bacterium]|nr:hypothetical protein [Saprospiraceae bacterium]
MTHHIPYSEEQLKLMLFSASKKDFAILYDVYAPLLFGFILRILPEECAAEKALTNTFIHIRTNAKDYQNCKLKILTWMLNIARKKATEELVLQQLKNEVFANYEYFENLNILE